MSKHNHLGHHPFNGKNFIILPIIFCAVIYLLLFIAFAPSASTLSSLGSLFFSDNKKDFSEEYNNIFVPVEESSESETSVSENGGENKENIVKISEITFPKFGEQFGELIIEDCQINNKLFFGDNDIALNNGVGIYNGSSIPGYGKTILIAGHNNTYFNGLKYAKKGQQVKIRTSYGNYIYEITDIQVKKATDKTAYDLNVGYENLIMYTCYPFDELGFTSDRYFVYAKPVSGPEIDKNN